MRTRYLVLTLSLLLLGSAVLAAEETKAPAPPITEFLKILYGSPDGQAVAPNGLAPAPMTPVRPLRWTRRTSTGYDECPPSNVTCVYYASGDCLWCDGFKTQWCDTYRCSDGVYWTCCVCDYNVC